MFVFPQKKTSDFSRSFYLSLAFTSSLSPSLPLSVCVSLFFCLPVTIVYAQQIYTHTTKQIAPTKNTTKKLKSLFVPSPPHIHTHINAGETNSILTDKHWKKLLLHISYHTRTSTPEFNITRTREKNHCSETLTKFENTRRLHTVSCLQIHTHIHTHIHTENKS